MARPRTPTGSIEGPVMVRDGDASGTPNFGDTITFHVESTFQLHVNVLAHVDGVLVMNSWAPFFPTRDSDPPFGLYSPAWQEGAADCVANLVALDKQGRYETIDSLTFHVDA